MTNPYNFVHFLPTPPGSKEKPVSHQAVDPKLNSGILTCRIYAMSPIFIPDHSTEKCAVGSAPIYEDLRLQDGWDRKNNIKKERTHKIFRQFFSYGDGNPVIPASSLKGCFRAVAEAACNGCVSVFHGSYDKVQSLSLPTGYAPCDQQEDLCPTCRLFGMSTPDHEVKGKLYFKGKVTFDDAYLISEPKYLGDSGIEPHPLILLKELLSPKPYHSIFYSPKKVAIGRKFYHHRDDLLILGGPLEERQLLQRILHNQVNLSQTSSDGLHLKVSVSPLVPGSCFEFKVHYQNLTDDELNLLLFSIELMPYHPNHDEKWPDNFSINILRNGQGHYHKIGYGKPAGLGSCAVYIIEHQPIDMLDRYSEAPQQSVALSGDKLLKWIQPRKASIFNLSTPNIRQLKALTLWPNGLTLRYPNRNLDEFNTPLPTL